MIQEIIYKVKRGNAEYKVRLGNWLTLLGTLNFCSRVSPYLNLILPALYQVCAYVEDQKEWKKISSRLISVSSAYVGE